MEPVADVRAEAVPKKAGHLSTPHRIILAILEYLSKVNFYIYILLSLELVVRLFLMSCVACWLQAGKSHEKTVSFDRETVFTYIKQTPVQTPR